jgi:hypothetical protein
MMRTKRLLLATVAVLALAAGVGIATFGFPSRQRETRLSSLESKAALEIEENPLPLTAEAETAGFHDFRFHSRRDASVRIGVELKACQCASVLIWVAPGGWKALEAQEFHRRAAASAPTWTTLEQDGDGFAIPPDGAGLLRLMWKQTKHGDALFWAALWVDDGEDRKHQQIEVPLHFVEPVVVRAADHPLNTEVEVGSLGAGEERTARFVCFSTTREKFAVTPANRPADGAHPCFASSAAQPLSAAELKTLSEKLGKTVRSGYRLSVTVAERSGDTRLDFGPFHHPMSWTSDIGPGHQVSSYVNGTVQGEVKLAHANGKPIVDLGAISPGAPRAVVFTLESSDPQLQLTVDEDKTLEFLKVELLDGPTGKPADNRKNWQVRVVFRSGSLFRGKFPNRERPGYDSPVRCALVFRITREENGAVPAGQPARRLFVPVRGSVTLN